MILSAQGRDNNSEELLPGSLHVSCERGTHSRRNHNGQAVSQKLYGKIVRIHVQFLRVQHAQFGIGFLDIIHVLHGSVKPMEHNNSVSKTCEVPLGPGIHNQGPTIQHNIHFLIIQLAENVLDVGTLLVSPHNHAVGL
uniref:Uncharacterized protein n=1 Tax=Cyprinus carpio TaxID=7962 RepID=A0A8C1TDB6_CYPCA